MFYSVVKQWLFVLAFLMMLNVLLAFFWLQLHIEHIISETCQ